MQYLIGLEIPKNYKSNVLALRESYNFKSTEPHINIISPKMLPDDDSFVSSLIKVCNNIKPFTVNILNIQTFDNKIIYQKIESNSLLKIRNLIIDNLYLTNNKSLYKPNFIIYQKKFLNQHKLLKIKKIAQYYLPANNSYLINSIVVYEQKHKNKPFKPYIQINLNK
ncbi:2'-5' RNA ligase family protein [Sedimentibacter sp. zth1]|uniref:2'-5' RNA ligase family protein n=1 Tax=Sedimentibacter sp. zth1 TaxID=2816908 RepID=UPI001A91D2D9|nr:2'-5' RNA ligase family protein [Sedimentibacter sp. zth1]QSX07038.1 2'-5' RNA ligase family protein [Sedimentibacter sp. zth1]